MVVEIRRPGLAGKDIAAVLLIAEDVSHSVGRPFSVAELGADLVQPCLPLQFRQRFRDGRQRRAVDQHVIHEADRARFILVDAQVSADDGARIVPVDHLVVAQDGGNQEAATAEAPFQRQQHCLALHMAFFLSHHCQHKQDDVAARIEGINSFLLEIHGNRRVVVLQRPDPCDTVDEVPGEAADRLGYDHVEFALLCVLHHELESAPVLRICAGVAVVDKRAVVDPVGRVRNQLPVVFLLKLHGNDLVFIVSGNATVCGDAKDSVFVRAGCIERGNLHNAAGVQPVQLRSQGFLGTFTL